MPGGYEQRYCVISVYDEISGQLLNQERDMLRLCLSSL